MPIHLGCPRGHFFTVEEDSIGTVLPCAQCGQRLLICVEARLVWAPTGTIVAVWRKEARLIGLSEQLLWLAQFKEENDAKQAETELREGKIVASRSSDSPVVTVIPLEAVTAIRAIQDLEEGSSLHVDHLGSDGKAETRDIEFGDSGDRDRAVAHLEKFPGWTSNRSQVGFGQAIAFPSFCIAFCAGALAVYHALAYFLQGKNLGEETASWFFLHLPINILGMKWTSIILGGLATLFLILLALRLIRHPVQLTLTPASKGDNGDGEPPHRGVMAPDPT